MPKSLRLKKEKIRHGSIMFKLFGSFCKRIESDKTLKFVVMLTKDRKNAEALKKCSELVEQYPYDVQIRHGLAMIKKEMG